MTASQRDIRRRLVLISTLPQLQASSDPQPLSNHPCADPRPCIRPHGPALQQYKENMQSNPADVRLQHVLFQAA